MADRYNNRDDYGRNRQTYNQDYDQDFGYDPNYDRAGYDPNYNRNSGQRMNRGNRRDANLDYGYRGGRNQNTFDDRGYPSGYRGYGQSGDFTDDYGDNRGDRYNRDYNQSYGSNQGYDRGYNRGYNRNYDNNRSQRQGNYSSTRYNQGYSNDQWDQGDRYDDNDYSNYGVDYTYSQDYAPDWVYTEYWFIPGPFEGVGPSNYQRSDDSIKEDVNHRLTQHGRINARDIQVDVNNGEVTLKGTVQSRNEKRMAEDVADSVSGVSDVHNQLKVASRQQNKGQKHQETGQKMSQHQIKGGQVRNGMDVVGKDGNKIGTVKEVRQHTFLVDRDMARDVFVPFDKAQENNGRVMVDVRADQVDSQNWDNPDLV